MLDRTKKTFRFPGIRLAEGVPNKIQVLRTGTFFHEVYGKFRITKSDLAEIKHNFDRGVRGIDLMLDYAHESDKKAAAWFKDLELGDGGNTLWGTVEWTPSGKKIAADREYRYVSADIHFKYRDNETRKLYGTVLLGAGLTNRPVIKNMKPIVGLSEYKGQDMAKKIGKKKVSKTADELAQELAEKEEENRRLRVRLDEMSEEDDESDDEDDADVDPDTASHEDLKAAHKKLKAKVGKMEEEMAEMKDKQAKAAEKAECAEKESAFNKLLAEGKAVPAQKEAFMKGDMAKFAESWKPVSFTAHGGTGAPVEGEGDAQDQINQKAQKLLDEKKVKTIGEGIRKVLAENPELRTKQMKETGFTPEFSKSI